jgi:hypothetical protein
MVSPEGLLGEAFHLLPLSQRDGEGNGLQRRQFHRPLGGGGPLGK